MARQEGDKEVKATTATPYKYFHKYSLKFIHPRITG